MSKKGKAVFALAEDFQAVVRLVPKLTAFIKVHKEIATEYQKFRKNGGAAIPGIEKHLGIKEEKCAPSVKKKKVPAKVAKAPKVAKEAKEISPVKKVKKKS